MSYHSILALAGEVPLDVLEFHWGIVQLTSEKNVPMGGLLTGQIRVVLDRLYHPTIAGWMADSHKQMSGKLVAHGLDGISMVRLIEFEQAYCFNQGLHFNGTGSGFSNGLSILISAPSLNIDGQVMLSSRPVAAK